MKPLLSRYRPRYLAALAYMLQASEYDVTEYLAWYHRARDFSHIDKRKHLVLTAKARIVLSLLWLLVIGAVGLALSYFITVVYVLQVQYPNALGPADVHLVVVSLALTAAMSLLLLPWVIPYLVLVPLEFGTWLIQKPAEAYLVLRAHRKLAKHPGVKIAIAGSFGKTTMKEILANVLAEGKTVAATTGNQNTPIGISRFVQKLTGNEAVLIFEFGEYRPGDVWKFSQLTRPGLGIITGINQAHLAKFKSLEVTAKNIFSLARYLKRQPVYVNGENVLSKRYSSPHHYLYTRHGTDGWVVSQVRTGLSGTRFTATKGKKAIKANSQLLGRHQIGPLVTAIAIADGLGLGVREIELGIRKTTAFEHRLQARNQPGGVVLLDDTYNGNPDGVSAGLEFLHGLKASRKLYITPGLVEMGEETTAVHMEIGKQLAKVVDVVVLIRNSITPLIAEGLEKAKFKGQLLWFDDGLDAYKSIGSFTKPGDVVLMQNDWPDQYA